MKCSQCGNVQEEGKFCGTCGGQLIPSGEQQSAATKEVPSAHTPTNDSFEKVKDASAAYWTYFVDFLKQPSLTFSKRPKEAQNGVISIVLAILFFSVTLYNIIKAPLYDIPAGFSTYIEGPSFFSVVGNSLFSLAMIIAIIISILFLINKFFGDGQLTFVDMTSIYGAHMTPFIVFNIAILLLAVINSLTYATVLLSLSFLLITFIVPLYLISHLLTKQSSVIDPFYGYITYIVASGIAFYVITSIFVDTIINQFLGNFFSF